MKIGREMKKKNRVREEERKEERDTQICTAHSPTGLEE